MSASSAADVYLDHHATTPCDPRVVEAMLPCLTEDFGNPSSTQHAWGRRAAHRVEQARASVAAAIGVTPEEIVFTSGATEANNLALFGVVEARRQQRPHDPIHVVTQTTEHKAILDPCARLEAKGVTVSYVPVESDGRLDPARIEAALRPETVLVSVMVANNEIGVVQPVAEIAALCRDRGILIHTDAAQALAHGDCRLDVDLMSLSAHKAYGPKGIGALYARRRRPRVRLAPRQHGGGHERGLRAGTLDVASIVGFGRAAELVNEQRDADNPRLARLRDRLLDGMRAAFPDLIVNGSLEHRLPHNLNVSLPDVMAQDLLDALEGVAISSGAACTSSVGDSSYVLTLLGGPERAESALRFGLGRGTTAADIDRAVTAITRAATVARQRPTARLEAVCGV
ncbi:MAG: cysteine desulfurase family protein [Acidobacteriota bacterium]